MNSGIEGACGMVLAFGAAIALVGCAQPVTETPADANAVSTGEAPVVEDMPQAPAGPVAIVDGKAEIGPANTVVAFHGSKPDGSGHDGGFSEFTGTVTVNPQTGELEGITVVIQTESIWSDTPPRLTNHLKSADFFSVLDHPTATFASTDVAGTPDSGDYTVTGDLTLIGNTRQISFPVRAEFDDGLTLTAEFTIDRLQFGMEYRPDQVNAEVALKVHVGTGVETAQAAAAGEAAFGSNERRGGRQGRGNLAGMFRQNDADGDGKLAGDEIPGRLREQLEQIDTNGDGAISQDEFRARMERFRQGSPGNSGWGGARRG